MTSEEIAYQRRKFRSYIYRVAKRAISLMMQEADAVYINSLMEQCEALQEDISTAQLALENLVEVKTENEQLPA